VKLSREFGEVTDLQCKRYKDDKKRVTDKKMSFQDFLGNLKAGKYMRNLENGYCEQVTISDEDSSKLKGINELDENKLQSVRIQKVSSGGFSSDTKAKLTPSIPFKLTFNGQEITVKTMSVYHPCPLRIEGVQADAVFSLNDPSFDDGSGYVILIPLSAKNTADPSIEFFDRILPQVNALMIPEATGQYMTRNVATGTNWSLNKVFTAGATDNGSFQVQNGYYEWKGMPTLERVKSESTNYDTIGGGGLFNLPGVRVPTGSTVTYSWKESGKPPPRYIMLDTPVAISASSLSSITQTLPVTPASDAVHAVLYSSNPLDRGIVHKQGPPNPACARESFADMNGVKEEFCDAWTAWAQTSEPKGFTTQQIFEWIFKILIFVAMGVGAYLALAAVLRLYDVELSNVSTGLGKITAVVFKSLKQKAGDMKGLTTMMQNPLAALNNRVSSVQNPLAALQNAVVQPVAAVQKAVAAPVVALQDAVAAPVTSTKDEAKARVKQQLEEEALKSQKRRQAAAEARKKAEDEAAAKKKADEEAAAEEAARKKAEDEEIAAKKKADKEAADEEAARKKAEDEAKKKAAEEERARKKAEDEAAAEAKRKSDEAAAEAKKKAEKEARVVAPPALPQPKPSTVAVPTPKSEKAPAAPEPTKPARNINTKKLVPIEMTKPSSAKSTASKSSVNHAMPNLNQGPRYMQPKKVYADTSYMKNAKYRGGKPKRGRGHDGSTRRAGY
jgi:hypothetical protein